MGAVFSPAKGLEAEGKLGTRPRPLNVIGFLGPARLKIDDTPAEVEGPIARSVALEAGQRWPDLGIEEVDARE
jgi:hypothetical protein